jgi:hypothetical protein
LVVYPAGPRRRWPSPVAAQGERAVIWSPAATTPDNHSVAFVEARPERWSPRGEIALRVNARDSLTYRVTLAGRTFARGTAAPGADAVIHAAPPERGWLGGSVDLAPDELASDDIRYFAVWIGPAPAVYATAGAGEFVTAALDALKASSRFVAGRTIAVGPAEEIPGLPAMITAPADPVRAGAANRALERLGVPWRFAARRAQSIDANVDEVGRVGVTERYDLKAQSGAIADTLGRVANAPWIVAGPRYVLVGSPLVASATTLPVQAGFVPWLSQTVADRLTGEGGRVVTAAAGAWVRRPAGADQLERPDGSTISMGDSVRLPALAGVYFFVSAGRRTGAIVVNPPARESQLDRMSPAELQQVIPGAAVITDGDATQLSGAVFSAASTRSLLPAFLAAALIALLAESLVVSLGAAREGAATRESAGAA